MKVFDYVITDEQGIHARPAGMLVKEAAKFNCAITIECNGKSGDAKRIFAVMSLGAKCGSTVNVKADGTDEKQAAEALRKFMEENL